MSDFQLLASKFQLVLEDDDLTVGSDLPDLIVAAALSDGIVAGSRSLCIMTAVEAMVDVTLNAYEDAQPLPGLDAADHVVEASVLVLSGRVVLMGLFDYWYDAARIPVPAGWLRVRVTRSNCDAAYAADLDAGTEPTNTERVLIQVWPQAASPVTVLKRWREI